MTRALVFLLLLSCGGGGAEVSARTISFRLRGSPPDATVTVDDQIVGSLRVVAARGIALPKGAHRVSVEAAGYFPWDKIIVATDQPVIVAVELSPIPD